ncbi:MAG TPA: type II CAAX endopeptidase family protein [Dyella sp.]|uniref:CPBP family intramembrane glutamic endopeptidase n=1 Tax=Dyella sp. TaxID=1869338 RepID=UPI002D798591|nr:type II CAAX endopeptidase family protein [Dyella sp.]HET6555380.1 type II CAAX endopeptidase family protein [Dyella sp.]
MAELILFRRRALVFLALAFGITWCAWGVLIVLAQNHAAAYGEWPFMSLYVLGGLGPTIAAYIAVYLTRSEAPLREFNQRVVRWRVRPVWYVAAIGLPIALAFVAVGIAVALHPAASSQLAIKPWYLLPLLFAMTIIGGGLEELGWRGIAQEAWGPTLGQARAALVIGPIWAAWHLPLFFLPGVSQYHGNFALFLLGVMGNALLFGWLYSRTRSILLCVFMHAASNAIVMLGVVVPSGHGMSLIGPCLVLAVGGLLFLSHGKHAVPVMH